MKKIFFTYSDDAQDVELYKELRQHFATYARKGFLAIIDKDELFKLSNDRQKTAEFLLNADITIPLLSIDYLNSDDCLKLLDTAATSQKQIIPVLLRDCDWTELEKIKALEKNMLPDDKTPVAQHITSDGNEDKVMAGIARKVKAVVFNDDLKKLEELHTGTGSTKFYYILAGIVLLIGILGSIYSYTRWNNWMLSGIVFLMFLGIALFAVKNSLFPTKFTSR